MANVGFKLGPQSALDTLLGKGSAAGATPGSFYLTSDTHRLYIGLDDTSVAPVNEGIITVTNIEDLPDTRTNPAAYAGRFYYVTGTTTKPLNILCIFNGQSWVQLNPDTSVGGVEWSLFEIEDNKIRINNTVYNLTNGNKTPVESNDLTFVGTNGIDIDFTTTTDANNVPHYTLTFKGDQYELGVEQDGSDVNVKLTSDEGHDSNFKMIADKFGTETDTNVSFTVDSDGNVKVGVKDSKNDSISVTGGAQGFEVQLKDNHGHTVATDFRPQITYGDTNKETVDFVNGVATLNVYSKQDIADTLKALNAMTYRGTIGNPGGSAGTKVEHNVSAGTTVVYNGSTKVNVSIGDLFMISSDANISVDGSTKLNVGTLIIAKGTEDPTTGYITDATLRFDVVEATKDTDSTYYFKESAPENGGGISLVNQTGAEYGALQIKGNSDKHIKIEKALTNLGNGGYQETLTISHGDVTRNDDVATTAISMGYIKVSDIDNFGRQIEIPAVTGVTTDASGHVTGITIKKYTVQDTCGTLSSAAYDTSVYTAADGKLVGIVKSTIGITAQGGAEQTVDKYLAFSSNSLQITNDDANSTTLGGSKMASGLKIDLVWGSFS